VSRWHIDSGHRVVIIEDAEPFTPTRLEAVLGDILRSDSFTPELGWVEDLRAAAAAPPFASVLAGIVLIDEVLGPVVKTKRWARVVDDRRPEVFLTARRAEHVMKTVGWKSATQCDIRNAIRWAAGPKRQP
jgi:hypothetical protein